MIADPARLQLALECTARLIAVAVALQSIELLQLRRQFSDTGIWRFEVLAREYRDLPSPLRALLGLLLPYRAFVALLALQLVSAGVMLICGCLGAAPLLLCASLLISVRFRGTFNGGSDMMTVVILLAMSVAACVPARPALQAGCLGYIAVQATLSYAIAGLTKLKESEWHRGQALQNLIVGSHYAVPEYVRAVLVRPGCACALSWLIIGFECGFVLAWFDPRVCAALLVVGALFHLSNAAVLGLNRFLFAWVASYPALLYVAHGL